MKETKHPYTLDDYKADLLELAQEVFIELSYKSPKISFREKVAAGAMLNGVYRDLRKAEPEDDGDAGATARKYAASHQRSSPERDRDSGRAEPDDDTAAVLDAIADGRRN